MNLILEFHNNLTRAENLVRLPEAAGFALIFLRRTYVKIVICQNRQI
ncbi:hypothetical protein [Leptospira noguchii]|nr:hypothetical protein [Leptospira noguchii]UOG52860.1 hypothetical protein MAL09_01070 [Leptospira noguchii]